jgi:benzoate-CoA ligase family protein
VTPVNAASFFVDDPVDEGCGDRTALVTPRERLSYRELRDLSDRAAAGLRTLGVEPERRVALLLPDGPAFAASFFGAVKLGAVAVPLNTRLAGGELRAVLADCRPDVVVADPDLARAATGILAELGGGRVVGFAELTAGAPSARLAPEPAGPEAMAFWLYTSGTTGAPKAAVHCHRTLLSWHHYGRGVLGVGRDDRVLATSRLFFAYALGNALLIPLAARASAYFHSAWPDPAATAAAVAAYRPTLFFSVPTFYARLLRAELSSDAFGSARLCVSAGERLPTEIYEAWRRRFGVELLDGIGATETVFMALSNRPGQSRPGSSGGPVPGVEARLLDAAGGVIDGAGEGVLWVRTASAARGYWEQPEASRRRFVQGWFCMGDVYARDADGFYYHRGREDDFFKVAGQWVAPAQVESALLRHPGVAEAGVVGAAEAGGLVKPFAFVVPREPGSSEPRLRAELLRLLDEALRPHERPRDVRIVDQLPRTATGKLQRFRLRAFVQGEASPPAPAC